jgi:hypothetical protein
MLETKTACLLANAISADSNYEIIHPQQLLRMEYLIKLILIN